MAEQPVSSTKHINVSVIFCQSTKPKLGLGFLSEFWVDDIVVWLRAGDMVSHPTAHTGELGDPGEGA